MLSSYSSRYNEPALVTSWSIVHLGCSEGQDAGRPVRLHKGTHGLCGCKRGRRLNKELSITEEKRKRNVAFHHEYGGESFGILEKEESKIFSERGLRICICFAVNMKGYNFFLKKGFNV